MIAGMQAVGSLTAQLRLYSSGNREAAELILQETLPRLRQIAAWKLAGGTARHRGGRHGS